MRGAKPLLIICTLAFGLAAVPATAETTAQTPAERAEPSKLAETLYDGFRASRLLDSHVFSRQAEYLGQVRNIVVADTGQIKALILQGDRVRGVDEFVLRIPWDRLAHPVHPGVLIADVTDKRAREFGLFLDLNEKPGRKEIFLTSEVLGDYARLQAGQGYGYVTDIVFTEQGQMLAVLIARDALAGGGTYAFPYPGKTGPWSPDMSYYGLPYVSLEHANEQGLAVDKRKFADVG